MMTFKEFVNVPLGMTNPGAILNTGQANYDNQFFGIGKSLQLPTPTLEIPTKEISGRIQRIFYTSNPITITLENGTIWKVSKSQWDYLKSIGREPREGVLVNLQLYLDGTIKAVDFSGPLVS